MATVLTTAQISELTTTSRAKGRPEKEYADYVINVCETGDAIGNAETDFSEVKPAHVHHMFKKVIKANELSARVGWDKTDGGAGVYLIPGE